MPAKEPLTIRSIACRDCDGRGIRLGPYDPETRGREVRACGTCVGWGISRARARQLEGQERRAAKAAAGAPVPAGAPRQGVRP